MWPTIAPRGRIDEQLLNAVQRTKVGAINCRSHSGEALVAHYREWVSSAAGFLRPHFDARAIDHLLLTRTYWATNALSTIDPQCRNLVSAELEQAVERFTELSDDLVKFREWWSEAARIVVIDTNVLVLHAEDFDSLDWFKLLDQRPDLEIRLVVPLVVVDELDNLKNRGPNDTRPRARAVLKRLEPMFAASHRESLPMVKHDGAGTATLEFLIDPPSHERQADTDSEIAQQAAMLGALTGFRTVIATNDTGMLMRAINEGLRPVRVDSLDSRYPLIGNGPRKM